MDDERPDGNDPITRLPPETPPELSRPGVLGRLRGLAIDLSPLKASRQFRLLFIGESVSDLGSRVTMVAVPFQVYQLTKSPLAVGLLALFELVPLLTLSLIGGAIADAVERRRLLLMVYLVLPFFSLALAWNAQLEEPRLWVMYVFATLSAAAYGLYSPAVRSAPPLLVPKDQLPSVIALTGLYYNFGSLAGPALGGLLIASIGLTATYLFDALTFVVAIAAILAMRPIPPAEKAVRVGLESIREGFRFLKGRPVLQTTFTIDLNAMIFGMPTALFPAVADGLGVGAFGLGLMYGAPYAGALLVSLLSGRAKAVRRQGRAVQVSVLLWGLAIAGFGFSSALPLALLFLAVAGGADMWSAIFRTTIGQTIVPDEMRGRLSGIELAVVSSGPSIGELEAGIVGSLVSVPFAIISGGLACVAGVGILDRLVPQFGRYDAQNPTP